jgi:RNA polymerase sigma-70 factor (ECF subfamily)
MPEFAAPWAAEFDDFEAFYTETYSLVFRMALAVLQDITQAEEVTHEVFLELLRGRTQFDPGRGSLRPWLATVARRRAIDRVRSVQSARLNDERFARLDSDRVLEGTEELVHRDAEQREIRDVLGELPERYREVLMLIYWKDCSQQDVADYYDIPLGTAKTRVRQALKALRVLLGERA